MLQKEDECLGCWKFETVRKRGIREDWLYFGRAYIQYIVPKMSVMLLSRPSWLVAPSDLPVNLCRRIHLIHDENLQEIWQISFEIQPKAL